MEQTHISYFDFLRGLAIIFVIACHSYYVEYNNPLGNNILDYFYLLLRESATCAVPIFLAQSGFFLAKKETKSKLDYFEFVRKYSCRIYVPMLVWSLPLLALDIYHGENVIKRIFFMSIGGYSIYYFIPLIIQFYILQPIMKKCTLNHVLLSFAVTVVSTLLVVYLSGVLGYKLPLVAFVGEFPLWLVYPMIGCYLYSHGRNYKLWPWIVVMIIGLLVSCIEARWLFMNFQIGLGVTKFTSIIYSCGFIMTLFNEKVQKLYERTVFSNIYCRNFFYLFVQLGIMSFSIYLVHCYFLGYIVSQITEIYIFKILLTLAFSSIFILLVKFAMPNISRKFLGFR